MRSGRALWKRGSSLRTPSGVESALDGLGRSEGQSLRGGDLHCSARRGIATLACRLFRDLEFAETRDVRLGPALGASAICLNTLSTIVLAWAFIRFCSVRTIILRGLTACSTDNVIYNRVQTWNCIDASRDYAAAVYNWRLVAVASPGYLAQHPAPSTPQDLVRHNCINHRQSRSGGLYAWEFEKGGKELRVRVEGQLTFNSAIALVDACVNGLGIGYIPESLVEEHVEAGRLVLLLDEWSPKFTDFYLYYPSRRQNSVAFATIVSALRFS